MNRCFLWVIEQKQNDGSWEPIEFCYSRKAAREFVQEWRQHNEARIRKYIPEDAK
jgi:hypothetical protein